MARLIRAWSRDASKARDSGAKHPGAGAVVAQGDAQAVVGDAVAVRVGDALDQAAQPQPPQVVGHAALAVFVRGQSDQRRDDGAQITVAEPLREEAERQQGGQQGVRALVAEAQRRGALAVDGARPVEVVEPFGSDGAVVAEALDAQQASVGGKADGPEGPEVLQPSADIEVVDVVDHRLGAQGATFLVVLLNAGVLVVDVQRGRDALGYHAGSVPRGGAFVDASVEDQLHVVGTSQVDVLPDDLLEQHPPLDGPVEDLGQRELRLQHGDVVAHARRPVGGGEGVRQTRRHLRSRASTFAASSSSARRCMSPGSAQLRTPLSRASNATPRFASWRLRYSWPLTQSFALYGKYEQNFRKNGPKSSSTMYT